MAGIGNKLNNFAKNLCLKDSDAHEEIWIDSEHENGKNAVRDVYLKSLPISFTVNGQAITLDTENISTHTSLARYLRSHLNLTGTKISCGQAGCGACVVTVTFIDAATGQPKTRSVNSCITPVMKCDGWDIVTVEGLGSKAEGLHPIQDALSSFHGTQCGFCSPGMVMVMNGLYQNNQVPSLEEVESLLDGNICRCTGYRPIFDAFKSFTPNPPQDIQKKMADIEDLVTKRGLFQCPRTNQPCAGTCSNKDTNTIQYIRTTNGEWTKPNTIDELMSLLAGIQAGTKYRLVAGNTGTGIFNNDGPYDQYFDITGIPELTSSSTVPFNVGAGMPLNDFINLLENQAVYDPSNFEYCTQMANHIQKVANNNVRNIGTIAGNLMLKHAHNDFPSDIFMLLETVGATLMVRDTFGSLTGYTPLDFLATSMDKKLIQYITLPQLPSSTYKFMSYKITPRSQNAHAYVNGACMVNVNILGSTFLVLDKPNLVFGGISDGFLHASATENYLIGKNLNDNNVLQNALAQLEAEVVPEADPVLASTEYRKHLAKALFYKFVLKVLGSEANSTLQSGATQIARAVSSGEQIIVDDPTNYPVTEPIQKIEGQSQCTGEAEYVDDMPLIKGELFGALVLSTMANCDINTVNASSALAMPGVVTYVDHLDIPGLNRVDAYTNEEIFSSGRIHHAGQPVGMIVAETFEQAREAAKVVEITYINAQPPILSIDDAISSRNKTKCMKKHKPVVAGKQKQARQVDSKRVTGEFKVGSQYHFHMETQSVVVRLVEEGQVDVFVASQWQMQVQSVISKALGIGDNKINVFTKRLGGAYGGKINKATPNAVACAIAANKLKKPVRMVLDLQTNMESLGKRAPYLFRYDATLDASNKLDSMTYEVFVDSGFSHQNPESPLARLFIQSCYNANLWTLHPSDVLTNTPSNTACRAPISTQTVAATEMVIEHICATQGLDPDQFRQDNFLAPGDLVIADYTTFEGPNPLPDMINELKTSSNYNTRLQDVTSFNQNNAWKKRGISLIPMSWKHSYVQKFIVQVSIYHKTGNVSVMTGGIEMGQGLNTKLVQVIAKELGVQYDSISIKPTNNFVANNNDITGGSTGSSLACLAGIIACQELRARMQPIEDSLDNPTWQELVDECFKAGIDLTARHMTYPAVDGPFSYHIWGAAISEVEIDVLTGEKNIRRVDVIEDTGASISPQVDIGQIEGSFVMGIGLWLSEEIKYNPTTGRLLTRDTWEYKPPASQDIPEIFNTTMYNSGTNPSTVLGSKATGEPPLVLSVSVLVAIRRALNAIKQDLGEDPTSWFNLDGPATNEKVQLTTGVTSDNFYL